jgi:SAM-dependent methyltransferase
MHSGSGWLFRQFRFVVLRKYIDSSRRLRVLDVGCGQFSPELTIEEIPNCEYHAVDLIDRSEMISRFGPGMAAHYTQIDLEKDGLSVLSGQRFDVVVIAHVLEHIANGLEVLAQAGALVAPGGVLFVEYPRLASVNLPSMANTLNFHDDPTHKRFYNLIDVANVMLEAGLQVRAAGVRRLWRRILLLPFGVLYSLVRYRRLRGTVFWDVLKFAEFAVGVRPPGDSSHVQG